MNNENIVKLNDYRKQPVNYTLTCEVCGERFNIDVLPSEKETPCISCSNMIQLPE